VFRQRLHVIYNENAHLCQISFLLKRKMFFLFQERDVAPLSVFIGNYTQTLAEH